MDYLNKKFLLDKRPQGMPQDDCWKFVTNNIDSIKKGEIIIQVKFLSIDPYMRGRMNEGVSYAAPAKIGEPMTGETVGTVVESMSNLYEVGDNVCVIKGGKHLLKQKILIHLFIKSLLLAYLYPLIWEQLECLVGLHTLDSTWLVSQKKEILLLYQQPLEQLVQLLVN